MTGGRRRGTGSGIRLVAPRFQGAALIDSDATLRSPPPGIRDPDGGPSNIGAYGGPGGSSWDLDADGFPAWWQPGPYDPAVHPGLGLDCNDMNPLVYPGSGC